MWVTMLELSSDSGMGHMPAETCMISEHRAIVLSCMVTW